MTPVPPARPEPARRPGDVVDALLGRPLPDGADALLRELGGDRGPGRPEAAYVSTPITTGRRYLDWRARLGPDLDEQDADHAAALKAEVVDANVAAAAPLCRLVARRLGRRVVDPTVLAVPGWSQPDYHRFWSEVIERLAAVVVFADGWQYSSGCSLEYAVAAQRGLPMLDAGLGELRSEAAARLLAEAVVRVERAHADATLVRAAARRAAALADAARAAS